jgi:hypothetical protein
MPKNIFEELAIAQHKEELARIKILSRIKSGDIKGAHRIAKPYLERLSQRNNEPVPTGWLKISKILCAVDIQTHGVNNTEGGSFPKEESWLSTALEIISNRAKGLIKALVPATMAIALMVQVLGPTAVAAGSHASLMVAPSLSQKYTNDEKSKSLSWELLEQGLESRPKSLNDRLKGTVHIANPKQKQAIKWSVGGVNRNESTKLIEAELIATNISNSKVTISQFAMTDSRYEGCEIKKDPNTLESANLEYSPSEIPPGACAVYKVTIAKAKSPQILFKTGAGELHSMNLNLNGFDKLSNPLERKSWAQYKLTNKTNEQLQITTSTPEGVRITNLKISDGQKELNIESPRGNLILKPQQVATLSVEAKEKYSPELELVSKSENKSTSYKLKANPLTKFLWSINQTYDNITSLVFNDGNENIGWEEIKTRFNCIVKTISLKTNPLCRTGARADELIAEIAKGKLPEGEIPAKSPKTNPEAPLSLSPKETNYPKAEEIMEKMKLQKNNLANLAKQEITKYKDHLEIQ